MAGWVLPGRTGGRQAGNPGTVVPATLGCLFHNHLDVLCPGGLGMGVCSTKRSHVPLESPYVTAFAVRGCVLRICPELLILGKGSIFLPRSVRRNQKGPRRCRRRGRVLSSHPEPRASPSTGPQEAAFRPHVLSPPPALTQSVG